MSQVSCIIPYYNGGDTIARAIDSIIDNEHCLEVIVVVDASPEPLVPHLTQVQLAHIDTGKLRVITLANNQGQASARNMGASVALGAYLSFLDQDDIYLPGFYEVTVTCLSDNPTCAAVIVGAQFYQNEKNILDEPDLRYEMAVSVVPWNFVVRRNVFWVSGAFPTGLEFRTKAAGEDVAFRKCLHTLFSVGHADAKLVRHYVYEGSATDRYLKRTEIVDGTIVFTEFYDVEENEALLNATQQHHERAWEGMRVLCAVERRQ